MNTNICSRLDLTHIFMILVGWGQPGYGNKRQLRESPKKRFILSTEGVPWSDSWRSEEVLKLLKDTFEFLENTVTRWMHKCQLRESHKNRYILNIIERESCSTCVPFISFLKRLWRSISILMHIYHKQCEIIQKIRWKSSNGQIHCFCKGNQLHSAKNLEN